MDFIGIITTTVTFTRKNIITIMSSWELHWEYHLLPIYTDPEPVLLHLKSVPLSKRFVPLPKRFVSFSKRFVPSPRRSVSFSKRFVPYKAFKSFRAKRSEVFGSVHFHYKNGELTMQPKAHTIYLENNSRFFLNIRTFSVKLFWPTGYLWIKTTFTRQSIGYSDS